MTTVTDLDLPVFDCTAPDFLADRDDGQLAGARAGGWLARSSLAVIVPEREPGEFLLRSRATAFPGRRIADFFGVTSGPLRDHIGASILSLSGGQQRRLRPWSARRSRPAPRTGGGR